MQVLALLCGSAEPRAEQEHSLHMEKTNCIITQPYTQPNISVEQANKSKFNRRMWGTTVAEGSHLTDKFSVM